ncbi:hypothetical protein NDU88_003538 [Pleurodeles waltl]|uniref:Uncharacterized protein n=1 Tax=Pleurodeles waltl TaxID=8319 RepID=A0AAV7M4B6_PLEWA|nr:hypothetical protein NDU88_003538 [Pleurodeles waltl]
MDRILNKKRAILGCHSDRGRPLGWGEPPDAAWPPPLIRDARGARIGLSASGQTCGLPCPDEPGPRVAPEAVAWSVRTGEAVPTDTYWFLHDCFFLTVKAGRSRHRFMGAAPGAVTTALLSALPASHGVVRARAQPATREDCDYFFLRVCMSARSLHFYCVHASLYERM